MSKHDEQHTPATLGDVLYPDAAKPLQSEQGWAGLVQSIANGDQPALHALYERAHRVVYTLIVRITGNQATAEELTLDVFHDVWRRAPDYDPVNGTVLGWIMNQARSRAIDRLRFEQRVKRVPPQGQALMPEAEDRFPTDSLESKQRGEMLKRALAHLTAGEREAIETAFFSDLTHAEVAMHLDQPLGTVKTRIRSGLDKLRHALAVEARNT